MARARTESESSPAARDLTGIVLRLALLGVLLVCSYQVLQPFIPALAWATMIVIASWHFMLKVERKLWNSRALAVIVMSLALVLVLIIPLAIAILAVVQNLGEAGQWIQDRVAQGPLLPPDWVGKIPFIGEPVTHWWLRAAELGREDLLAQYGPYLKESARWVVQRIGGMGNLFLHFLLTIIISAILYANGDTAARGILSFARRVGQKRAEQALLLAAQAIRAVANGVILTALVQSFMSLIGFVAAGVPYSATLAALAFFLSVVQIGAGPVLLGALIWLFYSGQTFTAWIFLPWAILTGIIDNFVRPMLIKRGGAELPLLLIFAGVIGGLIAFGIIGIFVGPVVLAVSYTWLKAWTREAAGD